ncbi:MAG: response regulator, partial [Pseudomonadota bacterium]
VSGILYVIAIFRYNTLDVLSVAQRLIAQNIKAGIVVIDHRHQVLGMNPYATGYWPHPSPIGEPLVHVIPECAGREMKDDDEWELVRTLEDREHILLAKVSEVSNHQVGNLGHALVFLDISDRKTAERVLREGLEAKGQFLANLSHELRTPLHGITGLLQLALSTNLSTQQKDYLTKADSSAQLLLLLINDVLDFSKLEAGKLEFERVSFELGTVVEQVRSAIGVNAAAKGIEFRINLEPFEHCVIGDPLRLSQVLMNLSSNAVKFTHAGYVELVIVVEHLSEKDATLRFSVTDTGIGIEQERIPKLFDLFAQAESSTTRRFGGTGLGLSISQQLVASMGGHIEVTSELGQGSCFFFSLQLPLSDEPPTRLAYDIARPDLSNFRFLVVDDSSINQQVAKELLQNAGANVETASNGHEALAALAKHHFDTVLMDVQMPELDGYETTKRIRENPALQSVPVIAMTANTRAEDKDRVIAAGMNDFVPKPFRDVELYATLSRWLKFEERENPAHVSSEASNTMGTAETLDFEAGLDRLQGNRALYFELLHALADELEGGMVALSDNAISDDAQKQIAHNLKGIAANLGANAVKDAADTLQSALPSKGLEPRSQSLQQLRNAIDRFHEHLAIIE